jgi:hypothetical protein
MLMSCSALAVRSLRELFRFLIRGIQTPGIQRGVQTPRGIQTPINSSEFRHRNSDTHKLVGIQTPGIQRNSDSHKLP